MVINSTKYLPRYWLPLHPDVNKPIGGVKQIHRLAEALTLSGRQSTLIQDSSSFHPDWFSSDVRTVSFANWLNQSASLERNRDIIIIPETFLHLFSIYAPGLQKIVFNQNGSYSFGVPGQTFPSPSDVLRLYSHSDLLHVLCVSEYDHNLLIGGFGLSEKRVSRIVNSIETTIFSPLGPKRRQIAFMPRKNTDDSAVVTAMLSRFSWFDGWELVPITGCTQAQVARIMQSSLLFLSFGHPEGFGLPMAEALACGCGLLGYSGLGGRELVELAFEHDVGLEVQYGDWYGFVKGVKSFIDSFNKQPKLVMDSLLKCSTSVRHRYAPASMQSSVLLALSRWESQLSPSV